MRLIKAREVQSLTRLSSDQLREWTARRGLIRPDVEPQGPGSRAGFTWQTVLLLRIAVVLKQNFHVELQAQRGLFVALRLRLAKVSFPALRGTALVLRFDGNFEIILLDQISADADELIIRLDPHLDDLSTGFGLAESTPQLQLFPPAMAA